MNPKVKTGLIALFAAGLLLPAFAQNPEEETTAEVEASENVQTRIQFEGTSESTAHPANTRRTKPSAIEKTSSRTCFLSRRKTGRIYMLPRRESRFPWGRFRIPCFWAA